MRLTKLFMFTTGVLLTLVTIMLARSVLSDWRTWRAAESGVQAMDLAFLAMKVAEKASAERGPTILVLNDTVPADPAKVERLQKARSATDAAFVSALSGLTQSPSPTNTRAQVILERAQHQLLVARIEVDRVAALPFDVRTEPGSRVRRVPIDQMFSVIDTSLDGVAELTSFALLIYPELSQPLEGARLGAMLREYAGRLGSQFTTPLATQKPLSDTERDDINSLVGRVTQLRQLIEMHAQTQNDSRVSKALEDMKSRYFAVGLPLINAMTAAGIAGKPYGMDSAQFVARYVPEMASIITMRDSMHDVAKTGATARVAEAKRNLALNAAIGLSVLLIELGVFLMIRKRVLQPLLASTESLKKIAQGKLDLALSPSVRRDEIGDLQNALITMRNTSAAKHTLEAEREALIGQLEVASATDYVTKLLNRRGFMLRAAQHLQAAVSARELVSLILIDIDHFKGVNDRYGHAAGDEVLRQIAEIGAKIVSEHNNFARYGGEEFVTLAVNCDHTRADAIAATLRRAVEAQPFVFAGRAFHVTISIGIATLPAQEVESLEALINRADEALYQAKAQGRNRVVQLAIA